MIYSFNNNAIGQDHCNVHIDKSFYVTGELIWYKLYLTPNMKDKNVAIKTSLVSANGNIIGDHFNLSEGKTYISGYYKLPFDLKSEVYSLVFSASRSKSSPEEIFGEILIPIYNDLEPIPSEANDIALKTFNSEAILDQDLQVTITLDKEVYSSREKVNAEIQVNDANGNPLAANVSVSVRDAEILASSQNSNTLYKGNPINLEYQDDTFLDNIYTKGSYMKDDDELISNEIIGAYASDENKLHFAVPDPTTGDFHVEYPDYYNTKRIQFFPYIDDGKDLKIKLNKVGSSNSKKIVYNTSVIEYIKLSRQRKKLFQRYSSLESNVNPKEYETVISAFKSNKSFDITEYKSFENVASFLKEVATPLRMKEKNGIFNGAMYMPSKHKSFSEYAESPPIYLLNGFMTRNSDYVAKIDLDLVTNIAMMYDPKVIRDEYKIFGSAGLVNIKLKSKDIMIPDSDKKDIFTINGLLPQTDFPTFDPSEIDNNQYQPFFRPQLYWNGNLSTDSKGNLSFDFFQSDDVSTFVIEVVVQTDNGSVTKTQKTYQSVWQ